MATCVSKEIISLNSYIAQTVYTACAGINNKTVPVTNSINIRTAVQVELDNMCINIGANSGSEKFWTDTKHSDFRQVN